MADSTAGEDGKCVLSAQAICSGPQGTDLKLVPIPGGRYAIAVRVGRTLTYVEDRTALSAFAQTWARAAAEADRVFGPEADAFTELDKRDRLRFERSPQRP